MRIDNNPHQMFNKNVKEPHNNGINKSFLNELKENQQPKQELEDSSNISGISNSFSVPKKEDELSVFEQIKKHLIQNIFSLFNGNNTSNELFPTKDMKDVNISKESSNPYSQNIENFANGGFVYEATQEYYQKTTIDFSTSATIKTPKGEYNIELNISFTQEFYAKRTTQIAFDRPMELELEKDDESLKNLKRLDLVFGLNDDNNDKNKDLFDHIKELLKTQKLLMLRQMDNGEKNDLNPLKNELFDSFKVWQKNENEKFSLLAVGQDGVGIFLSNSQSSSAYIKANSDENGFSYEAGYSSKSISTMELSMDIKA